MGNYERTKSRITELENEKKRLREQLNHLEYVTDEYEEVFLEIADVDQSIGECKGYLNELAQMDGYDSYDGYLDDALCW